MIPTPNIKITKTTIYVAMVIFSVALTYLIFRAVIVPMQLRSKQNEILHETQAHQAIKTADSISRIIPVLEKQFDIDSAKSANDYAKRESVYKSTVIKIKTQYDQTNRIIDSLPYSDIDSIFQRKIPTTDCNW